MKLNCKVIYKNNTKPKGVRGKLDCRWIGPFVVVNQKSAVIYTIRSKNMQVTERTVHVDQLRPLYTMHNELVPQQIPQQPAQVHQEPPEGRENSDNRSNNNRQQATQSLLDGEPMIVFYKGRFCDCGYVLPTNTFVKGKRTERSVVVFSFRFRRPSLVELSNVAPLDGNCHCLPRKTRFDLDTVRDAEAYLEGWRKIG